MVLQYCITRLIARGILGSDDMPSLTCKFPTLPDSSAYISLQIFIFYINYGVSNEGILFPSETRDSTL